MEKEKFENTMLVTGVGRLVNFFRKTLNGFSSRFAASAGRCLAGAFMRPRVKAFSALAFAVALFSSISFFSCENSSGPSTAALFAVKDASESNNAKAAKIVKLTGTVGGALPSAVSASAKPDVSDSARFVYFARAEAKDASGAVIATSKGTFGTAGTSSANKFEMPLEIGKTWTIICGIKDTKGTAAEGDDVEVYVDSFTKAITADEPAITHAFYPAPKTGAEETGDVALEISVSGTQTATVAAAWEETGLTAPTVSGISGGKVTISATGVKAGSHKLVVSFKSSSGEVLYSTAQTISVFGGMKTDKWVEDGSAGITSSGFAVDDSLLATVLPECIYVGVPNGLPNSDGVSASDFNSGHLMEPLASLDAAFKKIEKNGSGSSSYKIFVTGNASGELSGNSTLSAAATKARSVTVQSAAGAGQAVLKGDGTDSVITIDSAVPVTFKNIKITGGNASDRGGGIRAKNGSSLTIESGTLITGNKAGARGGGISTGGIFKMKGGEVSGNESGQIGGGIFFEAEAGSSFDVEAEICGSGALIKGNTAKKTTADWDGMGGGLYIGNNATVAMSAGEIKGNNAERGGGGVRVSGSGAKFELSGSGKITGNTADAQGGGIDDDAAFEMTGGEISGNTAPKGGAVHLNGSYTGGTYALASFKIGGAAKIPCSGGEGNNDVYACRASSGSEDAGKYPLVQVLSGGFSLPSGTKAATLTPQDWQRGLDILEASSGDIDSYKGYFALTDGDFNFSKKSGSATIAKLKAPIYIKSNGRDSSFASGTKSDPYKTLNYAVTNLSGGEPDTILIIGKVREQKIPGLSTDRCSALTIKGVVDDSNPSSPVAPEINASGGNTSALVLNAAAPITIQNLKITGGLGVTEGSYSYGGGIKLTAGTLCLADGAIVTGNKATYGGGVYVKKGASLYMYGTALVGDSADTRATGTEPETGTDGAWTNCANYASSDGGGIYSQGSVYLGYSGMVGGNLVPASLTGGVKRNLSHSTSGGISSYGTGTASDERSVLKMRAGYVSFNKACNAGGGIKAFQSNVEIADGEMSHNQGKEGGGISIAANSDVNFSGGTIKENTATASESYQGGGAVYVMSENTASFTMSGSASIPYGGAKNNNDLLLGCATDSYGNILRNASLKIASALTASGTAATITLGKWQRGLQFLGVGESYSALTEDDLGKFDFTDKGWDKKSYNKDNPGSSTATKNAAKIDADIYVAGSSPEKCKTTAGASAPTDTGNTSGNWAHPFASISAALALLDSSHDTIIVDGTVTGAQQQVPSTFTTSLPDGLTIKGYKASATGTSAAAIKRFADPSTETAASNGSALKIDSTVPVTIEDLEITGGKTSGNGGGINIVKGTVKLGNGAKIAGNEASGLGGGVYVAGSDASLFMYGSSLIGDSVTSTTLATDGTSASATTFANKAGQHGGGIYNNGGKVYIGYSGLSGSTPVKSDMASGYGVRRNIAYTSGSTSYHGGGIMNRNGGTVRIASGSISYNYSSYDGGGLYNNTDAGDVIIEAPQTASNKAVFEGNKAKGNGGAICNKKTLTMSAGQIGGSGVQNTVDSGAKGGAIFQDGTFNLSGSAVIYDGSETVNDVHLGTTSRTITVGSLDGSGTVATITPAEWKRGTNILSATSSIASATYNRFAMSKDNGGWDKSNDNSDPDTKYVCITSPIYVVRSSGTAPSGFSNGKTSGANGTKTSPYASIVDALGCSDLVSCSNTIKVAGTLGAQTLGSSIPSGVSSFTIEGYDSNATIEASSGSALTVSAAKTVTIKTLKITGGSASQGGGININAAATVNLDSGAVVTGNKATSGGKGAGVYVKSGATLNVKTGSEISSNTAYSGSISGGGIYNDGTVSMTGGTISSNTANLGGAIYNTGSLTMSGGTIGSSTTANQNSASGTGAAGGAIYQNGTFTVSGTAKVYEGSAGTNDVYLPSSSRTVGVGSFDSSNTGTVASVSLYEWKRGTNFLSSSSAISDTVKAQFELTKDNTSWLKTNNNSGTTKYVYISSPIYVVSSSGTVPTGFSNGKTSGATGTKTSPYAAIADAAKANDLSKADSKIIVAGTLTGAQSISSVTDSAVSAITLAGYDTNATINGNAAGSALTIGVAKTFTIQQLKITNGKADAGGGINITAGTVNLDSGAKVYSNKANSGKNGAGVYVASGATLNIKTGSEIYSNAAYSGTINGAGVYNAGTVDMTGGQIYNNTAAYGGGVFNTGTLYVRGSAVVGGTTSKATGSTAGNTCSNCATTYGGGVYNNGTFYLGCDSSGSSSTTGYALSSGYGVRRNYASSGGGIYLAGGTFKSASGAVSYNYASAGGAIYVGGGTNSLGAVTLASNTASGSGGAMRIASSQKMTVNGQATFDSNSVEVSSGSANSCGGAVYIDGTLEITADATFKSNVAKVSGGTGEARGGAIYNGGTLTMSAGTIGETSYPNSASNTVSGSTSKAYGGAIYQNGTFNVSGGANVLSGSEKSNDVYLDSDKVITIAKNDLASSTVATITPSSWTRGKAVLYAGTDSWITGNYSRFKVSDSEWSVGYYVSGTATADDAKRIGADICVSGSSGRASGYGAPQTAANGGRGTKAKPYAAISEAVNQCWTTAKDFTVYLTGTISGADQTIPDANSTAKTALASSITLEGVTGNTSDIINRSLTSAPTSSTVTGTALTINTATPVTITNVKITGGYAKSNGGGIYVSKAQASLTLTTGALVTGNKAAGNAGGIYFAGAADSGSINNMANLMMNGDAQVSSNQALGSSGCGGGVYLNYANLCMSGSSIIGQTTSNNTAASSQTACSNYAAYGGGVYIGANGNVWLGYTAESSTSNVFTGGIYYNYASTQGGGIASPKAVHIYRGEISKNGSGGSGGGVYLGASSESLTMTGGTISYNQAVNGGGIYCSGPTDKATIKIYGNKKVNTITRAVIDGNVATGSGGGLYLSKANLFMYNYARIGDTATSTAASADGKHSNMATENGGGIYIAADANAYIGYSAVGTARALQTGNTYGIRHNYAKQGGGIYNAGNVYFNSGAIAYNASTNYGGGVWTGGQGAFCMSGTAVVGELKSDDTSYASSTACSNYSGKGGGIFVGAISSKGGSLYLGYTAPPDGSNKNYDTSFTGGVGYNYAKDGGGIYINTNGGTTHFAGGKISNNTCNTTGGAVYSPYGVSFGGGIYIPSGGSKNNDFYCAHTGSDAQLKVLTDNLPTKPLVATITPYQYQSYVLMEPTSASKACYNFAITPDSSQAWSLQSNGYIKKVTAVTSTNISSVVSNLSTGSTTEIMADSSFDDNSLETLKTQLNNLSSSNTAKIKLDLSKSSVTSIWSSGLITNRVTSLTLPNGLTDSIWQGLWNASGLTEILVASSNTRYVSQNGILYSKDDSGTITGLVMYPASKSNLTYTLPSTVTYLDAACFLNNKNLQTINGLTQITNFSSFGHQFNGCQALTSTIDLRNATSATQMYNCTIYNCPNITTVWLPSSINEICSYNLSYCPSLSAVHIKSTTPPTLSTTGGKIFINANSSIKVYVPSGSRTTYINNAAFKNSANSFLADKWNTSTVIGE